MTIPNAYRVPGEVPPAPPKPRKPMRAKLRDGLKKMEQQKDPLYEALVSIVLLGSVTAAVAMFMTLMFFCIQLGALGSVAMIIGGVMFLTALTALVKAIKMGGDRE